jgi:hypothetical protein
MRQPSIQTVPCLIRKLADIVEGLILSEHCKKKYSGLPTHLRNEEKALNITYQKMLIGTIQKLMQALNVHGGSHVKN